MLEQRKHERFEVPVGTRALACGKIGAVIDISKGGISFMVLDDNAINIAGECTIDILCNNAHIDARQIPGKIVWDKNVSFSSIAGMIYKKIGVKFGTLSHTQQTLLDTFLLNCNRFRPV